MGFVERLKSFTSDKVYLDEPMKNKTSYRLGGSAKYYVEASSLKSLDNIISLCNDYKIKHFILGCGNNTLFSDNGFNGVVISLNKLNSIKVNGNIITAFAGACLNTLLLVALNNSLSGLEDFVGIPASVGGATYMNAGAINKNLSDVILEVLSIKNGKMIKRFNSDCGFDYRKSVFQENGEVICSVSFALNKGIKEDIKAKYFENLKKRNATYIKGYTCGSVFKNPKPFTAGKLIEDAGLKGKSIGGATVSLLHGNFIVNNGTATASDVYNLIKLCKEKVYQIHKIQLEEELIFVGDF